jgi:hypothetical protein
MINKIKPVKLLTCRNCQLQILIVFSFRLYRNLQKALLLC